MNNPKYQDFKQAEPIKNRQNPGKNQRLIQPMNQNIKLNFANVMNAQSFSFGQAISELNKREHSLRKSDSVDSIVDEKFQTDDFNRGTLSTKKG